LWATPNSVVLRRIWNPLLVNVLFAAAVAAVQLHMGTPTRIFPEMHALMGSAVRAFVLPVTLYCFQCFTLVFAFVFPPRSSFTRARARCPQLGLLLVFRTNAAYQRFWEGRIIWEGLLGDARSLARMCMLYRRELGRERVKRVANLVCTFPFVLSEHLGARVTDNYSHLVTREDLLLLNRIGNRPLGLANTMGMEIKSIPDKTEGDQIMFSSRERLAMLALVDKMAKAVGACERLVQTPIPLNYARHTSRFLSLW
jgi:putative membrane protein